MPYRDYKNRDETLDSSGNSITRRRIRDTKKVVKANEFDFYEMEAFEVEEVFLDELLLPNDDYTYYGAIRGTFISNPEQEILPKDEIYVLPLNSNIKQYPVVGENVVCVNYLGRTYYTNTINIRNNPNNNIKIGLSEESQLSRQIDIFQTIDESPIYQRNIKANPGDIVINGRFNSSIKVGENKLSPSIQLVVGHNSENNTSTEPVEYDINKDAASIYIEDGGVVDLENPNEKFKTYSVGGKKIILDADVIVINARQHLRLQSGDLVEILGQDIETKHNEGGTIFTGETQNAIDEFRNKFIRDVQREIDICINNLRQQTGLTQENFEEVKELKEKIEAFVNSPKQKISDFLTLLPTVKFNEYNDLVTRFNNIVAELPTIPPTDPVRLARVGAELISVLNDFSTLSFLRPDIVTD